MLPQRVPRQPRACRRQRQRGKAAGAPFTGRKLRQGCRSRPTAGRTSVSSGTQGCPPWRLALGDLGR